MSKVIRSAKPASRPTSCAPTTPVDGPDSTVRTGSARGLLEADHAAVRLRQMRRRAHAELRQPRAEPRDVALHHRAEIGVHHRGGQPLELAELGRDLVRDAGEGLGELLARGCGAPSPRARCGRSRRGSRPRPPARRPRAAVATAARTAASSSGVSTVAVVAHALRHLQPQVARHQHRRLVGLEVVEVGALLPADLQQVAEAVGGDQPGLHAAMLDQRIGRHRRAVAEIADRVAARRRPGRAPSADALRRCRARGRPAWTATFQTSTRPVASSNRQTSVKVPPNRRRHARTSLATLRVTVRTAYPAYADYP